MRAVWRLAIACCWRRRLRLRRRLRSPRTRPPPATSDARATPSARASSRTSVLRERSPARPTSRRRRRRSEPSAAGRADQGHRADARPVRAATTAAASVQPSRLRQRKPRPRPRLIHRSSSARPRLRAVRMQRVHRRPPPAAPSCGSLPSAPRSPSLAPARWRPSAASRSFRGCLRPLRSAPAARSCSGATGRAQAFAGGPRVRRSSSRRSLRLRARASARPPHSPAPNRCPAPPPVQRHRLDAAFGRGSISGSSRCAASSTTTGHLRIRARAVQFGQRAGARRS